MSVRDDLSGLLEPTYDRRAGSDRLVIGPDFRVFARHFDTGFGNIVNPFRELREQNVRQADKHAASRATFFHSVDIGRRSKFHSISFQARYAETTALLSKKPWHARDWVKNVGPSLGRAPDPRRPFRG